jgi:hypothetical protein
MPVITLSTSNLQTNPDASSGFVLVGNENVVGGVAVDFLSVHGNEGADIVVAIDTNPQFLSELVGSDRLD